MDHQFQKRIVVLSSILFMMLDLIQAADIEWIGAEINVDAKQTSGTVTDSLGWRNSTDPKAYDVDGNNIYGTDGYNMRGGTVNPAYISTFTRSGGGNNFGYMDDPSDPTGLDDFSVGFWGAQINYGSTFCARFTITGNNLIRKRLRIGIQFDTYGTGTMMLTLTQTVGGSSSATSSVLTFSNNGYDFSFFDIKGASDNDEFEISMSDVGASNTINYHAIGGVAFDSADIPVTGTLLRIE
jgi:hypothetical protein